MSGAHAKYSPSSMERIIACPGSVKLSIGAEDKSSAAAIDGERAHECLEMYLKHGPGKVKRTTAFLMATYDEEMIQHAKMAAKFLWDRAGVLPVESEKKVYLDHIDKELNGTLDAETAEPFGILDITDFKFGKFIVVNPENNPQLLTYAIGAAHKHHYNFEKVRLTIIQPRAKHKRGPIRTWEAPIEYLFKFSKVLRDAIAATKVANPRFSAGDHCMFCPGKNKCDAYDPKIAMAGMRSNFGAIARENESPTQARARAARLFGKDVDDDYT